MCFRVRAGVPHLRHPRLEASAIKRLWTVIALEMVAWETAWMSDGSSWMQRSNPGVRDPAAG